MSIKIRSKALSLLEMLMVVATLMVLMALLLPAVRTAKAGADSARCGSNLRQWGIAFRMYAEDNGGFYPLSWLVDDSSNAANYNTWMGPYFDSAWRLYNSNTWAYRIDRQKCGCPYLARYSHPTLTNYAEFPYSYNAARMDYPYYPGHFIKGIPGIVVPYWTPGVGIPGRYGGSNYISKYWRVPQTMLYNRPAQSIVMFCGITSHFETGDFWGDWDVKTGAGNLVRYGDAYVYDFDASAAGVHNGRDNHLFMDGHVESLKPTDTNLNYYIYNRIPSPSNPWPK